MSTLWWGRFDFEMDNTRHWRVGPYALWLSRRDGEFRLATSLQGDPGPAGLVWGALTEEDLPVDADTMRFGVDDSVTGLELVPLTADRAFIFKSENPFIVPQGSMVTAFMSSPVWVRLQLQNPTRLLHEMPTVRPSDTWFGPSTMEGELCYAARTSVRFHLENLPVRSYRAVTVVRIENRAATPLPLARLRLPLPQLSLYSSEEGRLWTETVSLTRKNEGDFAEIKLSGKAPRVAGKCTRVAKPREDLGRRPLIRSFTGLLGLGKEREGHGRMVE